MWQKAVAHTTAFFVGLMLGFFFVIAPLFAGGPWSEYIVSLLLVLVLFLVAGISFGAAVPKAWSSLTLTIPSIVLVVILYLFDKPDSSKYIFLFIAYPFVLLISAIVGERIGSFVRSKWKSK